MSFQNPGIPRILRRSVQGMEAMHSKMFDPPKESPITPDRVNPTNPLPEVMAASGFLKDNPPDIAHTLQRQLMHGDKIPTWDGQELEFMLFRVPDGIGAAKSGTFPAPTLRLPRGVVFHCETDGSGPPPHTIHWHGQEPTPMNDGVGHCSMELGHYIYQWQPNFIGSYFYHCHRNTVQHFEFGLYGFTIIDPPDAFFASIATVTSYNPVDGSWAGPVALNNIPIGACRDGKFRTAANLAKFPQFGQTEAERPALGLEAPDPRADDDNLPPWLKFKTDPHAYTVAYDVEAIWVFDDRDINWSNLAPDARATYPQHGDIPGVNDNFHGNAGGGIGPDDFFAFNDFRSTHFFVTGVPVPDESGTLQTPELTGKAGAGEILHGIVIPPELMSGVSGVQVSINAEINQNILLRVLNAAYNSVRVTFPVDIVIIAWDGRALGVPPFGKYNEPVLVPAGTPMEWSVARRFDCLIRSSQPVNGLATVEFIDTLRRDVRFTARIPVNIGAGQDIETFAVSGNIKDESGQPMEGVIVTSASTSLGGSERKTAVTDALGYYSISGLNNGTYRITPSSPGVTFESVLHHCHPGMEGCDLSYALVTVAHDGVIGVDFNATGVAAETFSISGRVATSNGAGVKGVTMTLQGAASITTVATDANGMYTFAGLANGNYVLTPSLIGYKFAATSMQVVISDANVADRNFVATKDSTYGVLAVSGSVTNAWGAPVAGVAMTLTGVVSSTSVTNASGNYEFSGLPDGKYSIAPSRKSFTFTPASRRVSLNGAHIGGVKFTAVRTSATSTIKLVRAVMVNGVAPRLIGPFWRLLGRGTPGARIRIFLGPDLTGPHLASVLVNKKGVWKLERNIRVRFPVNATSISIFSSTGGILLNQKLVKRR